MGDKFIKYFFLVLPILIHFIYLFFKYSDVTMDWQCYATGKTEYN